MDLKLESGKLLRDATENDILAHIDGEAFAILSADPNTYLQCGVQRIYGAGAGSPEPPDTYILEYQDGSLDKHYRATDRLIPDRVRSVFIKYLRGDLSWLSDFRWEKMSREDLGQERFALNSTFTAPHGRLATEGRRTQRIKNWIVVAFTVLAYGVQAPFYAEHPYRAIGDWIGTFTFEMIFISGFLWFLLKDWKSALRSLTILTIVVIGIIAVLFLIGQAVQSPFRAAVVILLVIVVALLYKISENLNRRA